MKYCIICVQPDTRPNSVFSEKGVCPACDYYAKFKEVDWLDRYAILEDLIATEKLEAEGADVQLKAALVFGVTQIISMC